MAERLPTEAELDAEIANPTVAVVVNEAGDFIRFIRQDEMSRAKELSEELLKDAEFWRND
jgi:hypothetical protein